MPPPLAYFLMGFCLAVAMGGVCYWLFSNDPVIVSSPNPTIKTNKNLRKKFWPVFAKTPVKINDDAAGYRKEQEDKNR